MVNTASSKKCEAAVSQDAQEGEGFEEVEGSGLVVGRVAHRSNQSDYYIDGRKRQQKDVVACLLQEGIDLDNNRFLILQVGPPSLVTAGSSCSGHASNFDQICVKWTWEKWKWKRALGLSDELRIHDTFQPLG